MNRNVRPRLRMMTPFEFQPASAAQEQLPQQQQQQAAHPTYVRSNDRVNFNYRYSYAMQVWMETGMFPAEWSCQCGGRWELFAVSELQQQELHQQHPLQPVAQELAIHSSQVTWRVPGLCRQAAPGSERECGVTTSTSICCR